MLNFKISYLQINNPGDPQIVYDLVSGKGPPCVVLKGNNGRFFGDLDALIKI
jgi:hypothetical protein